MNQHALEDHFVSEQFAASDFSATYLYSFVVKIGLD
jgi:hypothetical protein